MPRRRATRSDDRVQRGTQDAVVNTRRRPERERSRSRVVGWCADELEVLVSEHLEEKNIVQKLRNHIEDIFGPHESKPEEVRLDQFVENKIQAMRPRFAHRKCQVETSVSVVPAIWVPSDVLEKIVEGLVRNAIENTPDSGNIIVSVKSGEIGPVLEVKDTGIGMSEENQRLLFENYFTAYNTMQYSSRNPYDFGAGGSGFDLLRMRIFSERYHFELKMKSSRCDNIPSDADACPGNAEDCVHAQQAGDCLESGGTAVTVQFFSANRFQKQ